MLAINFFIKYSAVVYILLAIGLFLLTIGLIKNAMEKQKARYGLEHEIANTHTRKNQIGLLLLGFVFIGELVLHTLIGPSLPALGLIPTATNDILTIQSALDPGTISEDGGLSPTPSVNCVVDRINITSPLPGEQVSGNVILVGSADIPNFGFYKYEFSNGAGGSWNPIQAGREIIQNNELGYWDTTQLVPGDYLLRLIVIDNEGNSLPACVIPVRILED